MTHPIVFYGRQEEDARFFRELKKYFPFEDFVFYLLRPSPVSEEDQGKRQTDFAALSPKLNVVRRKEDGGEIRELSETPICELDSVWSAEKAAEEIGLRIGAEKNRRSALEGSVLLITEDRSPEVYRKYLAILK